MRKSRTLPFAPLLILAALSLSALIGVTFASNSAAQNPPSHDTRSHEAHALPASSNDSPAQNASSDDAWSHDGSVPAAPPQGPSFHDGSAHAASSKDESAPSHAVLDHSAFKKIMESGWPSGAKNQPLAELAGEWHYKAAFWAAPNDKPKWTKGVVRNEMTLDSRFLSSTFAGKLNIGGNEASVKGQGLIGYDNARRAFSSVWVDTLSTSLMTGVGKYDSQKGAIVESGEFTNPLTGAVAKFRSELQFAGPEDYKRTIFTVDKSGKETKLMEFDCSKRP